VNNAGAMGIGGRKNVQIELCKNNAKYFKNKVVVHLGGERQLLTI
jgi:hypothetical protein